MFYLYQKECQHCGLKYLGKTKKDPFKYRGSGVLWVRHIKKYKPQIITTIIATCYTEDELKEQGIYYSKLFNIVESDQWANLRPETSDGGDTSMCINYKESLEKSKQKRIESWKTPNKARQKVLLERKTFEYRARQSKSDAIHTPYGVYPSIASALKELNIGDFKSFKSWLDGKVVSTGMVNACRNNFFTLADVGQNTNELGWYYTPIALPHK